jgi:hypothetical protein
MTLKVQDFVLVAMLASGTVQAESHLAVDPSCQESKKRLENYFMKLPKDCKKDQDCRAFYIRAGSCEAPVVLSQKALNEEVEKQLLPLQNVVRDNCFKNWTPQPCEPLPSQPKCFKNICKDLFKRS